MKSELLKIFISLLPVLLMLVVKSINYCWLVTFTDLHLGPVIKLKIIAFFLSLLMIMQMLPLRQIGKVLASNQWTEELPHDVDDTDKDTLVKFNHLFLPAANYTAATSFASETKALAYIHFSEQIPSNHSTEVVSPPPDSVC